MKKDDFVEAIIAVNDEGRWLCLQILNDPDEEVKEAFFGDQVSEGGLELSWKVGVYKTKYFPEAVHYRNEFNPKTQEWEPVSAWTSYEFQKPSEMLWQYLGDE